MWNWLDGELVACTMFSNKLSWELAQSARWENEICKLWAQSLSLHWSPDTVRDGISHSCNHKGRIRVIPTTISLWGKMLYKLCTINVFAYSMSCRIIVLFLYHTGPSLPNPTPTVEGGCNLHNYHSTTVLALLQDLCSCAVILSSCVFLQLLCIVQLLFVIYYLSSWRAMW